MSKELNRDELFSFAAGHREGYEGLLRQFVETPTVSVDPAHAEDIRRGVDLTVETLRRFGAETEVYEVDKGNPIVHGVFGKDKNLPTVTVYNHIDVQPASKETEPWRYRSFCDDQKRRQLFWPRHN